MKTPFFYYTPGLWFISVRGYVLHFKDTRRHFIFFSERNGYGPRALHVFGWRITVFKPKRSANSRAAGNLLGAIISGIALGLCFVAVMAQPPADGAANEKAARLAEARMKARIFAKYPDPALASMSSPVGAAGKGADK